MENLEYDIHLRVLKSMIRREFPYITNVNIVGKNNAGDYLIDIIVSESKLETIRPEWKKNWWIGIDGNPNPSDISLNGLFEETEENTDSSPNEDAEKIQNLVKSLRKKDWLDRNLKGDERFYISDYVLGP